MKTAIFIQDGDTQLVLTPENQFEQQIVKNIYEGQQNVTIKYGSFYECRGGYFRADMALSPSSPEDKSLMIRLKINAEVIT